MTEAAQLRALAHSLLESARAARQRRLLLFAGGRAWCDRALDTFSDLLPAPPFRYTAGDVGSDRAVGRLGSELDALLIDAHDGFDADACGALAGTLRAGGLLLLLTPPLDAWPTLPDRALARWLSAPHGPADGSPRYRARLAALLCSDPLTTVIEQGKHLPVAPTLSTAGVSSPQPDDRGCLTSDQRRAVDALLALAGSTPPGALVLSADRGRGKSAALGLAAAGLLGQGRLRVVVTAPRRAAAAALFAHAGTDTDGRLTFVPPDELLRTAPSADLLLVDEAAAIPAPLLAGLLDRYPRCAFATTVHGYEGTGRGFATRFRATLDRRVPGWREVVLRTPVRWADGDPLEALLFRALLLDGAAADANRLRLATTANSHLERLDRDALAGDERLLGELCGLLVEAHYRTTPNDLRLLLDAPGLAVHAALHEGRVAAVAVTVDEGGFDEAQAFAAWCGTRRLRGHLVAQSLATHAGLAAAPSLRLRRIRRIAVHPNLRRQGFGQRLIEHVAGEAEAAGIDLLCTSFGADGGLLAFWHAGGFTPARVGFRRDAASGAHTLIMLRPLNTAGTSLAATARTRLGRDLEILLGGPLRDLEPELASAMRRAAPASSTDEEPDADDWAEACAFAFAQRAPDAALPAVRRLLPQLAFYREAATGDTADHAALIARFAEAAPWSEVATRLGVHGRDAATERLRATLRSRLRRAAPAAVRSLLGRLDGTP